MFKKILITITATILIIFNLSTSVFADKVYVPSPIKNNDSVKIVGGEAIEGGGSVIKIERKDGCFDRVILTPYENKESIERVKSYKQLCDAYDEIEKASDLSSLDSRLVDVAHAKGAETKDLVVTQLFDITIYEEHNEKVHDPDTHDLYVELELEVEDLNNFVCVMVYVDGNWMILDDVKLDPSNPRKMFVPIVTGSGAYAIVTANDFTYQDIACACNSCCCIIHWIISLMGLLVAYLMAAIKFKDDKDDKDDNKSNKNNEDNDSSENDNKRLINLIKLLIVLINAIIVLILVIFFRGCKYDIYALIINYLVSLIMYLIYREKKQKTEKEEDEYKN